MECCRSARRYDAVFGARFARRAAQRYRRRGLDRSARRIVAFAERHGLEGATVLEVGGGVGEIEIELLKRGAARAVCLELSPAYDAEAARLVREAGIDPARVERRLHDLAAAPGDVEPADIVVLHRVVCCYPDYERLLTAAGDHARRALVYSHPPRNAVSRAFLAVQNGALRVMGKEFRAFAHPPGAMLAVAEARGLRRTYAHRGIPWHVAGLAR
ncbi:MAG TPA: methyltransferase domain-containing protein [Solirubrobacteraceae bacterium]|nr:methyltransferase domain-containing protein [Solirubrobacteraceae bacterium]